MVRMVPEGSGLAGSGELVQERMAWGYRALSDPRRTIRPSAACLEETMPMLQEPGERSINGGYSPTYNAGRAEHGRIRQLIDDVQRECVALVRGELSKCLRKLI